MEYTNNLVHLNEVQYCIDKKTLITETIKQLLGDLSMINISYDLFMGRLKNKYTLLEDNKIKVFISNDFDYNENIYKNFYHEYSSINEDDIKIFKVCLGLKELYNLW